MTKPARFNARFILCAFSFFVFTSAMAAPATELRFEDLVIKDGDFKEELKLSDNQKTLWKKVEDRMRDITRTRQSRNAKLQAEFKVALADPQTDLRQLLQKLDEESDLSRQEDKTLRELWLEMDDALEEGQRKLAFQRLTDRLEHADERGFPGRPGPGGSMRGPGMHGPHGGGMPRL